jgi:hypothetical protein
MSNALRVLRHESELGSWELVTGTPMSRLRGLVCDYEGYMESGASAPVLRQQVPTPRIPLIVNFGAPWNVAEAEDGAPRSHDSFIAGLGERSSFVAAAGSASCIQVNLTPLGAFMFLGLPMHELANRVVPLEDVLPRPVRGLAEQLEAARGWEQRFDLLDTCFVARFAEATAPSGDVPWA